MPVAAESRPLTAKQAKFAAKVADGTPKAVAHREVYKNSEKHQRSASQRRKAVEVATTPNVAAEIRRLTWLSFPPLDDVRGMREQAVRVISDLSRSREAPHEVRLKAALALYKIAETTRAAADPRAETTEQDKLLASLRKLYATIGKPDADEPDIGPAPRPCDDEPIDIQAIALPDPGEKAP